MVTWHNIFMSPSRDPTRNFEIYVHCAYTIYENNTYKYIIV